MADKKVEHANIAITKNGDGDYQIVCFLNGISTINATDLTFEDVEEAIDLFMGKVKRIELFERSAIWAKTKADDLFGDLISGDENYAKGLKTK